MICKGIKTRSRKTTETLYGNLMYLLNKYRFRIFVYRAIILITIFWVIDKTLNSFVKTPRWAYTVKYSPKFEMELKRPLIIDSSNEIYDTRHSAAPNKLTEISCYDIPLEGQIQYLLDEEINPDGKNIFFHETKCHTPALVILPREACTIESAAKTNPDKKIFFIFSSPVTQPAEKKSVKLFFSLTRKYNNIFIRRINIKNYTRNTRIALWYNQHLFNSKYPATHARDVLNFISAAKFGGVALGLGVIVLKNLSDLMTNSAGLESEHEFSTSFIHIGKDTTAALFRDAILNDLSNNFNGFLYYHNGRDALKRVYQNICTKNINFSSLTTEDCQGLSIIPRRLINPMYFEHWYMMFDSIYKDYVLGYCKDAYLVDLWENLSKGFQIQRGSGDAFETLVKENCPVTYLTVADEQKTNDKKCCNYD